MHFCVLIGLLIQICVCLGNPGTSFLLAFPQNRHNSVSVNKVIFTPTTVSVLPIYIGLSNGDTSNVESYNHSLILTNGEPGVVSLPGSMRMPLGSLKVEKHAIVVRSSNMITVIVRNIGSSNSDSYLALPISQLGTEYHAVTYDPVRTEPHAFLVVAAVLDNTFVNITLPYKVSSMVFNGVNYSAGNTIKVVLKAHEALQLQSAQDLTGAHVTSDQPVGVWSGLNRTSMPTDSGGTLSHVLEMVPPAEGYGHQFVLSPRPVTFGEQIFRLVATLPGTSVTVYYPNSASIVYNIQDVLEMHEIISQDLWESFLYVEADGPILVMRFTLSNSRNTLDGGDAGSVTMMPQDSTYFSVYRVPVAYLSDWKKKHTFTYIIDYSEQSSLMVNGLTISAYNDSSGGLVNSHAIAHRPDLVAGSFVIELEVDVTVLEVRHERGVTFLAYLDSSKDSEGEAFPLAYKDSTNLAATQASLQSRQCLLLDKSCQMLTLFLNRPVDELKSIDCCLLEQSEQTCEVDFYEHYCSLTSGSRTAITNHTMSADSLLHCSKLCDDNIGCFGANYELNNDVSERCQFLMSSLEDITDTNGEWKFIDCVSRLRIKHKDYCQ